MKSNTLILSAAILVIFSGFVYWLIKTPGKPGELDGFATCLADKGVIFYGAFWCPHCQAQKALFGRSVSKLPYHECSTPDGNSQNKECTDAGVESYPTWVFPDGSRASGEQTLETLAEKSQCILPAGEVMAATSTS